jgi:hypothetical protein
MESIRKWSPVSSSDICIDVSRRFFSCAALPCAPLTALFRRHLGCCFLPSN